MLRILLQLLKIITVAAMALLVVAGGVRAFQFAVEAAQPADAGKPVKLTVSDGETASQLAQQLADSGLIRSTMLFEGQLRLSNVELKPGVYTLAKGMSAPQIIERITSDAPPEAAQSASTSPSSFAITIPEGWRIEQIAEEYEKLGGEGGYDAFMQAVQNVDRSQYDFLADVPSDLPLEGYLFPDTYTFATDKPDVNVATMLQNFGNKYTPDMRARTTEMGLTIPQVVTFASLVEREAQVPDERPKIADVYISRWEQGWRLDADPTVQYILGKKGEWWPKLSSDDLFAEGSFNMYQNDGIPPGPICNPGFASIQAVLEPAETDYMYFVAKGDSGEHAFAVTKEEQDANVEEYLNNNGG